MSQPRRYRKETAQPSWLALRSPWRSMRLTLVPPTNIPPLAPLGPSVVLIAGIPFSGIAFVLQKSAAVSRET